MRSACRAADDPEGIVQLNATQRQFLETYVLKRRIRALDLASDETRPGTGEEGARARSGTALQLLQMLQQLATPAGANPVESGEIEGLRASIRENLEGMPTERGLADASDALQALDAAVRRCQQRVDGERETRRRKAEVLQARDRLLEPVREEPLPNDRIEIARIVEQITQLTAAELPLPDDLDKAETAIAVLREAIEDAGERLAADRRRRVDERTGLRKRLGEARLSDEATAAEKQEAERLSGIAAELLAPDVPGQPAIEDAGAAIGRLQEHVRKVNEDIVAVRKVRFALATKAGEQFGQLDITAPPEYPEGKTELNEAHQQLKLALAPFLDWQQVTTWDASALEKVVQRIAPLGLQFEAFRNEVAEAKEAVRVAAEGVAQAIAKPPSAAFAPKQTLHFEEVLKLGRGEAEKDVLAAKPHIETMNALVRQIGAASRLRKELQQRIAALTDTAPAAATPQQKKRWGELRAAAVRAADEVVQP